MLPTHKSLIVSSEEWTVAVISFLSVMAIRGTYRRWPHILGGVAILYALVYALPSRLWLFDLGASYLKVLKWTPGGSNVSLGKGPRIVVFGGGDVATLNQVSADLDNQSTSWTEVLCREV